MKKQLPAALLPLGPTEKLVWVYIDQYPGEHSIVSLKIALGVYAGRALVSLVERGLLVQESPPAARKAGKYRVPVLEEMKPLI